MLPLFGLIVLQVSVGSMLCNEGLNSLQLWGEFLSIKISPLCDYGFTAGAGRLSVRNELTGRPSCIKSPCAQSSNA